MNHKQKMEIAEKLYMEYYHGDDMWWGGISNTKLLSELFSFSGAYFKIKEKNGHLTIDIKLKV